MPHLQRRELIQGSLAIAAIAALHSSRAYAFPTRPGEKTIEWLDKIPPNPVPEVIKNQLVWEGLDSWVTPNDKFFSIAHFNRPVIDESTWKLEIDGMSKLEVLTRNVKEMFGEALPAQTLVPVPKLAIDPMLFEVEAVVVLD